VPHGKRENRAAAAERERKPVNYYIADGSTQRGPFTVEALRAQGLGPETLVWREGAPNWVPAGQVEELVRAGCVAGAGSPSVPPPPPPPGAAYPPIPVTPYATPSYNPNDSKRIAAGILGILLGGLGIHKFILGYNTAGIIMLVVTVVLTPLTCGFGWAVMHVIGLVEGILYLTKSDEEFYRTYIAQKRDWF
jgi:TM2 domain-containing membrane protein YozV